MNNRIQYERDVIIMLEVYFDVCGNQHQLIEEIARGGQGAVYRTANSDIAIKLEMKPNTEEALTDVSENEKFIRMGLLPLPQGISVTLPVVVMRDCIGYAMNLLGDMKTFQDCFSKKMEDFSGIQKILEEMQVESVMDLKNIPNHPWLDQFLGHYNDTLDADLDDETASEEEKKQVQVKNQRFLENFYSYIATGGKRRRLLAYYKAACLFSQLHSRGLVFSDFSPKNIFLSFDFQFDQVWLIDADNLNYQSITWNQVGFLTSGFVAPEVALGQEGCSMYSDIYSFAVALFLQLTGTHPFKGAQFEGEEDLDDEQEALYGPMDEYGEVANKLLDVGMFPWILDKEDDRNVWPTEIESSLLLSPKILGEFQKVFSKKGKEKNLSRQRATEWAWILAEEMDTSACCPYCHMDFYLQGGDEVACPWCDFAVPVIEVTAFHYFQSPTESIGKKGKKLWRFSQEFTKETKLPTRLLYGQYVRNEKGVLEENDSFATVRPKDNGFVWTYQWSTSNQASFQRLGENGELSFFTGVVKIDESNLRLVFEDKSLKRKVLLEVHRL